MKGVISVGMPELHVSDSDSGHSDVTAKQGLGAAAIMQKSGCGACHSIPGVAGAIGNIGPNLSDMVQMAAEHLEASDYTGSATTAKDYIYLYL